MLAPCLVHLNLGIPTLAVSMQLQTLTPILVSDPRDAERENVGSAQARGAQLGADREAY